MVTGLISKVSFGKRHELASGPFPHYDFPSASLLADTKDIRKLNVSNISMRIKLRVMTIATGQVEKSNRVVIRIDVLEPGQCGA